MQLECQPSAMAISIYLSIDLSSIARTSTTFHLVLETLQTFPFVHGFLHKPCKQPKSTKRAHFSNPARAAGGGWWPAAVSSHQELTRGTAGGNQGTQKLPKHCKSKPLGGCEAFRATEVSQVHQVWGSFTTISQ